MDANILGIKKTENKGNLRAVDLIGICEAKAACLSFFVGKLVQDGKPSALIIDGLECIVEDLVDNLSAALTMVKELTSKQVNK